MFLVSLSYYSNLFIFLGLTSSTLILYFLCFYYWKIKNPYFIIFNYGSTLCSLILCVDTQYWGIFYFNLDLTFLVIPIQFMIFFIIIYLIYLSTLTKIIGVSSFAKKRFITHYGGIQAFGKKRLDQFWHDNAVDIVYPNNSGESKKESIELQRKKEKKNKFHFNLIILLTIILTVSFLGAYFYELMFQ